MTLFSREDSEIAIDAREQGCGCVVISTTDIDAKPIYTSNGEEIETARDKIKNSRVISLEWFIFCNPCYS